MSTPRTPRPQDQMALPQGLSPDALDSLTELTTILTRLRSTIQSSGTGSLTGATPGPSGATPNAGGPGSSLSLKDVPAATDHLKHKLQKARVQVRNLPDMDRTMAEQEREMASLEERIQSQRQVLETLKNGCQVSSEDVPMGESGA